MTRDKLYDQATDVTAEDGEVILDGPDAVDSKSLPRPLKKLQTIWSKERSWLADSGV
jgi:hypothetical protein